MRQIVGQPSDPLSVAISYMILRNGVGVLGLLLPVVLVVGGGLDHVQTSLSAYYHHAPGRPGEYGAGTMRDAFVGMLCAIGAFLFFYRGHTVEEDFALNVAGAALVFVAWFPMDWPADAARPMTRSAIIHYTCATVFFVMIAYVCVFRARDTLCIMCDPGRRRNFELVYLLLGLLMLATPATVAALAIVSPPGEGSYATLIVEIAGVLVFASYWLVKGFEIRTSVRGNRDGHLPEAGA